MRRFALLWSSTSVHFLAITDHFMRLTHLASGAESSADLLVVVSHDDYPTDRANTNVPHATMASIPTKHAKNNSFIGFLFSIALRSRFERE